MPAPHVLILTALRFEADGIARAFALRFDTPMTAADADRRIALRVVGPLATRLPDELAADCAGIVLAGLGGGLDPQWKRGDVVIDDRSTLDLPAADNDDDNDDDADALPPRVRCVTADRVIATPADKADLRRATGGAVVDMESDRVRAWAADRGVPFLGLRAISDTADEVLEPAVLRFVDAAGFTRPGRVAAEVLRRPALLATLLRLRHSGRVVDHLAVTLHRLLSSPTHR
ncbi:MAG: phosphorylase family protein [Tepidisphaeraceae bacterium]